MNLTLSRPSADFSHGAQENLPLPPPRHVFRPYEHSRGERAARLLERLHGLLEHVPASITKDKGKVVTRDTNQSRGVAITVRMRTIYPSEMAVHMLNGHTTRFVNVTCGHLSFWLFFSITKLFITLFNLYFTWSSSCIFRQGVCGTYSFLYFIN